MTADDVHELARQFWESVITDSPGFKGKRQSQAFNQLRDDLASVTVGRAVTNHLCSKANGRGEKVK